jgi:hypothetical protein
MEDDFHKLPLPALPADGGHAVVTDAGLADIVRIELWKIGLGGREVQLSIAEDGVRLSGVLFEHQHRQALEVVRKLAPGKAICDTITTHRPVADTDPPGHKYEGACSSPIVFVARYCGLDAPSITAGVRTAAADLARFFAVHSIEHDAAAFIIYRNLRAETVTVEVGFPVGAQAAIPADPNVRSGRGPAGPAFSLAVSGGARNLGTALEALRLMAVGRGFDEPTCYWQHPQDINDPWPPNQPTHLFAEWGQGT